MSIIWEENESEPESYFSSDVESAGIVLGGRSFSFCPNW